MKIEKNLPMKGITCCGDCIYYDWKKKKCKSCKSIETDPRASFFDDCPLPDVVLKNPEARLLTIDEIQNLTEGTPFVIEQLVDENDKEYGYFTLFTWAVADAKGKIIHSFQSSLPTYVIKKIPYRGLAHDQRTVTLFRFWTAKPTKEQSMEVKWNEACET